MINLQSPREVRALLERHGFRMKKRFGQNFLMDASLLENLVAQAEIQAQDRILEIGPGIGTLTRPLAMRAAKVLCMEIDHLLLPLLSETLEGLGNVEVASGDIMKANWEELNARLGGPGFMLVSNLPYNITTPVLMEIFRQQVPVSRMVLMVQREAADRILAAPSTKAYGTLSVAAQLFAQGKRLFTVPPGAFFPVPGVQSAVVSLKLRPPQPSVASRETLFKLIDTAFAMRRKTLVNNLMAHWPMPREEALTHIERQGLPPDVRGEALTPAQFAALANDLSQ